MKKFLVYSAFVILSAGWVMGQAFTNVSGTVVDPASQTWSFATISAQLQAPFGNPAPLLNQGHVITDNFQTVVANGSGIFNITLDDNNAITPAKSQWAITVCPNTSSMCTTFTIVITGSSMNISSNISLVILAPSVNAAPTVNRAYNDSEMNAGNGAIYWRTSDNTLRGCQAVPNGACTWVGILGSNGVTSLSQGQGISLSPNPITSTGTISIANIISSGSCTNCNITYNAQGQITAASNGSGGGGITCSGTCTANTFTEFGSASTVTNSQVTDDGSGNVTFTKGITVTNGAIFNSRISSYNGLGGLGNGMTQVIGYANGSTFSGNITAFNLATVSSAVNLYRISCYLVITVAASVSSTVPSCQVQYTDNFTNVSETASFGTFFGPTNTIGSFMTGSLVISVKPSTNVNASSTGYASNAAGMTYEDFFTLERY